MPLTQIKLTPSKRDALESKLINKRGWRWEEGHWFAPSHKSLDCLPPLRFEDAIRQEFGIEVIE